MQGVVKPYNLEKVIENRADNVEHEDYNSEDYQDNKKDDNGIEDILPAGPRTGRINRPAVLLQNHDPFSFISIDAFHSPSSGVLICLSQIYSPDVRRTQFNPFYVNNLIRITMNRKNTGFPV